MVSVDDFVFVEIDILIKLKNISNLFAVFLGICNTVDILCSNRIVLIHD